MKRSDKPSLKNTMSSLHSKSKRQSSTPKKSKTSMITMKPSLNSSLQVMSPTSTVNIKPSKHSSPFDLIISHETSFNRLICKQPSLKPSPQKDTNRFNAEMREILNRSDLTSKNENIDLIKQFLMESNKLFYDHMRRENKKMKMRLKEELYQYIQGIKTEIIENIKGVLRSEGGQRGVEEVRERIKELNTTILEEKFKIEDIIMKTGEEIQEMNNKELMRINESIAVFNEKLEEYSEMVKVDFFGCFSDKLSDVIERYNENFSTVNCNVDALGELMAEIIGALKFMTAGKRSDRDRGKTLSEGSPAKTAKFVSLQL